MKADHLKQIVRYCIGTDSYRRIHIQEFVDAVRHSAAEELYDYLESMHMVGLFEFCIDECDLTDHLVADRIRPFISFQKCYVDLFLKEMRELGPHFTDCGIKPVALKGPTYWSRFYPTYYHRRVTDMDLMIMDGQHIKTTCTMLGNLGYRSVVPIDDSMIFGADDYAISSFIKPITLEVDSGTATLFDQLIEQGAKRPGLKKIHGYNYQIPIEIDIHKSIFLLSKTLYPTLCDIDFIEWELVPSFRIMSLAAELPYLSTKLWIDVQNGVIRCLKLVGDSIRILTKASQAEVDKSIETADRWHSTHQYMDMLNCVLPLAPELELASVNQRSMDIVGIIIDKAFATKLSE